MPTCPGCEQSVSYERLPTHQRHCPEIHGGDPEALSQVEGFEERLVAIERRLDARIRSLEVELDRKSGRSGATLTPPGDASPR